MGAEDIRRQGFTEENSVRLEYSLTGEAGRVFFPVVQAFSDFIGGIAPSAGQTFHEPGIAMELEYLFRADPGFLVKVIDVLGDDAVELAHAVEFGNRVMGGIRLELLHEHIFGHHPVLFPGRGRTDVFLVGKILGVDAAPEATGPPEIRNPGLGTHAGAGENHQMVGAGDGRSRFFD